MKLYSSGAFAATAGELLPQLGSFYRNSWGAFAATTGELLPQLGSLCRNNWGAFAAQATYLTVRGPACGEGGPSRRAFNIETKRLLRPHDSCILRGICLRAQGFTIQKTMNKKNG
jgi:hypothetical protein